MKIKVMGFIIVASALLSSCGGSVAGTTSPDNQGQPATTDLTEVLKLVNEARATGVTCGSTAFTATNGLSYNGTLATVAQKHSEDMEAGKEMSHTTPEGAIHFAAGSSMVDRVNKEGYSWRTLGENVARGQTSAEQVMNAWLRSEGHCKNIMNPDFTELGLGESAKYWTQIFAAPR